MNSSKISFLKNTVSLYLMNIVKLLFPLLTLPYLTRVLSTDSYGVVTYVKSFIVYVQLIIDFGFLLSATKKIIFAGDDKKEIGIITGDTLVEKIILSILATIFFLIVIFFVPILKEYKAFSLFYLIATLITIFLFDFMFRGLEKMHLISVPYIISKSITTFFTFMLVKGDNQLLLIPILEGIGNIVAVIISLYFVKQLDIKIYFSSFSKWIKDLKESSIYFISNFATTIFGALTTVIAGAYLSMSNIAYWGICMQVLSAAKSLYNPITNSLYPHMLKEKDINFIKKINKLMLIPMIIGSFIVIFGANNIMKAIGGVKYIEAGIILKILLPAFIFSFYSMLYGWPVLGAIGKVKETTTTTVFSSIFQLCFLTILIVINRFNLYTLAISCSLSEVILFIARFLIYRKNIRLFNSNIG